MRGGRRSTLRGTMGLRLMLGALLTVSVCAAELQADGTAEAPCKSAQQASDAALQAAARQLPLQRRAAVGSKRPAPVVRVATWKELEQAVQQRSQDAAAGTSATVFELQSAGPITATSTLRLRPGMSVVARQQQQQQQQGGGRTRIVCADGVRTAFDVQLAGTVSKSQTGVLLQGLHISGCSGSALTVSGQLAPADVRLGSLPPGLHLVDASLSGNRGGVGGGIRASRAAVYLESVAVEGNAAEHAGAGVSVSDGVLVVARSSFTGNQAGPGKGRL